MDERMEAIEAARPGPWKIEATAQRFIVYRVSHWNTGWREYLTAHDGVSSRPSHFKTRGAAQAAIDAAMAHDTKEQR